MLLLLDNFEHLLVAAPVRDATARGCRRARGPRDQSRAAASPGRARIRRSPARRCAGAVYGAGRRGAFRHRLGRGERRRRPRDLQSRRRPSARGRARRRGCAHAAPRALLEQLRSSLHAPSSGRRDAPARQQTIRATVDWSYELLDGTRARSLRTDRSVRRLVHDRGGPVGRRTRRTGGARFALGARRQEPHRPRRHGVRDALSHAAGRRRVRRRAPRRPRGRGRHPGTARHVLRGARAGRARRPQGERPAGLEARARSRGRELQARARARRAIRTPGRSFGGSSGRCGRTGSPGATPRGRACSGTSSQLPASSRIRTAPACEALKGLLAALRSDPATARAELDAALGWLDTHDDPGGRAVALVGAGDRGGAGRPRAGPGARWSRARGCSRASTTPGPRRSCSPRSDGSPSRPRQ